MGTGHVKCVLYVRMYVFTCRLHTELWENFTEENEVILFKIKDFAANIVISQLVLCDFIKTSLRHFMK